MGAGAEGRVGVVGDVHATIAEIRARGVPFVVAPYEADAQLAHLVESGHAAAALTEDSDLLPFGCPRTLYKMEPSGGCELIEYSDLQNAEERGSHLFDGEWRDEWEAWSRDGLFVDMCVLAGTDYLPSIVGVGVKTAHRELRRAKSLERAVPRLPNAPRGDDLNDYLAHARQARHAFLHHWVWSPDASALVRLRPPPPGSAPSTTSARRSTARRRGGSARKRRSTHARSN